MKANPKIENYDFMKEVYIDSMAQINISPETKRDIINMLKTDMRDKIICPVCNTKPVVVIEGRYNESVFIKCQCGALNTYEKGI